MLDWHQDYTRPLSVKNWKMEFLFRYLLNENIFRISIFVSCEKFGTDYFEYFDEMVFSSDWTIHPAFPCRK